MSNVSVSQVVDVPAQKVWSILSDFGGIYRVHPRVERSPLLSENTGGLGARRRCEFNDGNHVVEVVTGWDEGKSMTVDIVEGSMPLHRAQAKVRIEPKGTARSEVTFDMEYEPKFGPIGKLMDMLMMRSQFRKILGQVIDGIETHAKTGGVVGKDGKPLAAAAA